MPAGWHARLALRYWNDAGTTRAHDLHEGPLRVLRRLYPEGPAICHHVVVHPPGGIVGGDRLALDATLGEGSHVVVTTPGAARFYRSEGAPGTQQVRLALAGGARLEWMPMEAIAYSGCRAENRLELALEPGAQLIGWDVLALGLPASNQPFAAGAVQQHLELPGHWLERGRIAADDRLLRDSPLGLGGARVLATAWWAEGEPIAREQRQRLLDAAREHTKPLAPAPGADLRAGVTAPHERVIVLRALAQQVEPAMQLLQRVRAAWRAEAWGLAAQPPRIWRT
ncbi:MAG: urease accessory protein UreD [Rubrivivax sp.]